MLFTIVQKGVVQISQKRRNAHADSAQETYKNYVKRFER